MISKLQTPKFVGAIIENEKSEILLQKRDARAPTFKNCWTLFGGKVETGETPRAALLRELAEELSLTSNLISKCKVIQKNVQNNDSVQYVFLVEITAKLADLKLKEGVEMKFINRKNLFKRKFAFNIREVLKTYLKENR